MRCASSFKSFRTLGKAKARILRFPVLDLRKFAGVVLSGFLVRAFLHDIQTAVPVNAHDKVVGERQQASPSNFFTSLLGNCRHSTSRFWSTATGPVVPGPPGPAVFSLARANTNPPP
jgi:hypothetical protein